MFLPIPRPLAQVASGLFQLARGVLVEIAAGAEGAPAVEEDPLEAIRRAATKRGRADQARREATDELREHCREAQAAGVSITRIASEAGLSRQAVYDLLDSG